MSEKFKNYYKACRNKKAKIIIVTDRWVLGDDVSEMQENIEIALGCKKQIYFVDPDILIMRPKGYKKLLI